MLFTKAALISCLVLLASAQEPEDAIIKNLNPGFSRNPTSTNRLMTRDFCSGTCTECFGAGYILCPGSSLVCYLPGDAVYGIDSCTGGSSATTTADASTSTPTSTSGSGTDYCYGSSCTSCFGAGYLQCPDGVTCYNPNDPQYNTCPDNSTSGGSSGSSSTSCAAQYGSGSVPCGTDSCYNPSQGDVCCGASGYYCQSGYTCSSVEGKCCAPGSTSSSCSSSGSGGGLLSTSLDAGSATTTSDSSYATSSSGLTFNTNGLDSTTTGTSTGSSSTGLSQIHSGSGAGALGVGRGLLVAAGVGALVL